MTDFKLTLNETLTNLFGGLKHSLKLNQIEAGPLGKPITIEFYEKWLQQNNFGTMTYLKDHFEIKKHPQQLNANLKSVITISQSYFPAVQPPLEKHPARVALYAQNNDYHFWLKEKLGLIIDELKIKFPENSFLPYVDSGPVLERNWSYQNALGWFGKNTCLIHPDHGSLFFIAEILSDLDVADLPSHQPLPDFCGKCQKCIEVCPTQALVSPREMKADRCISYLTIEAKVPAPIELRKKIGDWFFGCDLCQTVCPWNEKVFRQTNLTRDHQTSTDQKLNLLPEQRTELIDYFKWLLTASHNQIQKKYLGSPLARAGAKGLKRNALIVIANRNIFELKAEVENLLLPELVELREWTLTQLNAN